MTESADKTPGKPTAARTVGKYTLIREVGRGGMGVVYEALDTQVQRSVALKLMLPRTGQAADLAEQERQRFAREAQMAAKLKHPNIVTLYEAGEIQGKRYLAMEFIQGKSFSTWSLQKGLGLRAKVAVLRDVALAVHHAHEQGVLHRDLKPQNILVGAKSHPYVMDFGLAKAMGADTNLSLTGDGLVVGTPAYMSPEQARGAKTVDGRTDVYSLGVMLYELLAGRKPFEGETAIEILMKASKDRAALPSSTRIAALDPDLDRAVENICLKALEKNPQDRYASARALAQDLTRWLDGEAVHVTTVTRRRARAQSSSKTGLFIGIGAAALLVVGAVLFWPRGAVPSAEAELSRARKLLREKKFTDARIEFGKALAKEPANAEGIEGDRLARAGAEAERLALAKEVEEKREQLRRQLETERAQSVRDIDEAEKKVKGAAASASDADQKRLLAELDAIKEKARKSEEEAEKARAKLRELEARSIIPAPAPVQKPDPLPPKPPEKAAPLPPAPPPPPAPAKVPAALVKEAVDAAVDRFDLPGIFKAADAAGPEGVAVKADALRRAKKQVKSRDDAVQLAGAHLRLADDAMEADDVKAALLATKDASSIARQAGDAALADEATAAGKEFQTLQGDVERYLKAQKTLTTAPDDPTACADAGRHLCLGKDRWDEGLPLLARGADEAGRKLAQQELAKPVDPAARKALADAWWAASPKEKAKAYKSGALLRALHWYELAEPALRGVEKTEVAARIDACYRQALAKLRAVFVTEKSMKPYPIGHKQGAFPEQKTDDATGPFRGEPVYFDQRTGTDVVYEIRSGRRLSRLAWKGAAMATMTFEILDPAGTVLAKGGPYAGGNVWGEFALDFPPLSRFMLRLRNNVSTWYLVDRIELK